MPLRVMQFEDQSAYCCLATVSALHVTFVGTFTKLQKAMISSVMFVSLYAWSILAAIDAFS